MAYLLIIFLVAVALSPLMWFKTSPGQARKVAFRRRATELGLKVRLVPEPTADENDLRPTAVSYYLPYIGDSGQRLRRRLGLWTLLRGDQRGWPSDLHGWHWFRRQADGHLHPGLAAMVSQLPEQVVAICADKAGLGVILDERGSADVVDAVAAALAGFQERITNGNRLE